MGKKYGVGLDIGSTCAKTAVIDIASGEVVRMDLRPTGWSSVDTSQAMRQDLQAAGIDSDNSCFAATGYGRVCVPFADKCITEITCHAKGACRIFGSEDLNVIDIGGQDTKIIVIRGGKVNDFLMNDKCSAGTGRFLEVMANTLCVSPEELCEMAARGSSAKISSLCTVFAESEVISLIGRGTSREDIAFAVVNSIVQKVHSQAGKALFDDKQICLTGGLCDFPYIIQTLSKTFRTPVATTPQARYAGALGAALFAASM